jgi:hypothetical protein
MLVHDPGGSFANNDEAHHHRLLGSLIGRKSSLLIPSMKRCASLAAVSI